MHLGIMQNSLAPGELERSFDLAGRSGADGLELACDRAADLADVLGRDGIRQVQKLSKSHKVRVPSIGLGVLREDESLLGDAKAVSAAKDVVHQGICAAEEIGARVVLLPFLGKAVIETEAELDRVIENLEELAEQAEEASVVLGIESTLNVDQQKHLLAHLGAYTSVRVYYDTGNALSRKFDPATYLRDLGADQVCQMHFKDVRLGEEGRPPDFDVALGDGDVDFPGVVNAIRALGFDGWVVLETPATAKPLAAAKANLRFVRGLLDEPGAG